MAKAFLFDLNGTMIDDMNYHVAAWHKLLNDMGANISMERMKEECYGKANELIERIFPGRFSEAERDAIGDQKEAVYREEFRPYLQLLPGLREVLETHMNPALRWPSARPLLRQILILYWMD